MMFVMGIFLVGCNLVLILQSSILVGAFGVRPNDQPGTAMLHRALFELHSLVSSSSGGDDHGTEKIQSTSKKKRASGGGGGRAPSREDELTSRLDDYHISDWTDTSSWQPAPCQPGEAKLIVLQITDVYTLEHLASFKTLLEQTKEKAKGAKVISVLTGDFLSPYLLSSIDRGAGMMNALNKIPMDYLTWGNHEADIGHKTVCKHVRNFVGTWLNSNMLDHEAMESQKEYDIVTLCSQDGSNSRRIGLVGLLSNDPKLYEHFKGGAFGGATIDDPWQTLESLQQKLMGPDSEHKCDTILPLQHLYVPDDKITCRNFDFPVVLSGHDHHRVDEVVEGTRLLKPGMDAVYTTVLEMTWPNKDVESNKPTIKATFVKTSNWEPDGLLDEENEGAYNVLEPLRNTELASVPKYFQPLSSVNSRGAVTSMGQFICSLLKSSMNLSRRQREHKVDTVLLMGGNIRGGTEYAIDSFFSLEALEAEIKSDEVVAVVPMPGWLLAEGISATHAGDPIPGWMQYDSGIIEDFSQVPPVVTHVTGKPLDMNRVYRVGTKISDLLNGQCKPWTEYYSQNQEVLPPKGAYVNIQAELLSHFARSLWRRIWDSLSERLDEECDTSNIQSSGGTACNPELRLETLDADKDGVVSLEEIQLALQDLGLSIDEREQSLSAYVRDFADTTGSGRVTLEDIAVFCDEIGVEQKDDEVWVDRLKSLAA